MKNTFFTSDWHYGHANIIRLCERPFKDIHEMHSTLIENYRKAVSPNDTVYFLGDICWNPKDLPELLKQLPGYKVLIAGNHDKCFEQLHYANPGQPWKGKDWMSYYREAGFQHISAHDSVYVNSSRNWANSVWLSHFPYADRNDTTQSYRKFRLNREKNKWLIHGHIHNKGFIKDNQINISVEMWDYSPVHMSSIQQIIEVNSNFYASTDNDADEPRVSIVEPATLFRAGSIHSAMEEASPRYTSLQSPMVWRGFLRSNEA